MKTFTTAIPLLVLLVLSCNGTPLNFRGDFRHIYKNPEAHHSSLIDTSTFNQWGVHINGNNPTKYLFRQPITIKSVESTYAHRQQPSESESKQTPYSFEYEVSSDEDPNLHFGHRETADADNNRNGLFHVLLPDGKNQTTEYVANSTGFHPTVKSVQVRAPFGNGNSTRCTGNCNFRQASTTSSQNTVPVPLYQNTNTNQQQQIGIATIDKNVVGNIAAMCMQNGQLKPCNPPQGAQAVSSSSNGNNVPVPIPDSEDPSEENQNTSTQTPYSFAYDVSDPESYLELGHRESADANNNRQGVYFFLLPDGTRQTVEYIANDTGYYPNIKYEQAIEPLARTGPVECAGNCDGLDLIPIVTQELFM